MKVTYLGHSGFLVETNAAYYLFDYIRGTLPDFSPEKPLHIFASHFHADHFCTEIFRPALADRTEKYWLSKDIFQHRKKLLAGWQEQLNDRIVPVSAHQSYSSGQVTVSTLRSTDIGVAFLVEEANGARIYHAGDLNWWHWEGEPDPWNPNMEAAYKEEISRIHGQHFDAAFVPLDPRLGDAYRYGLAYFEQQVRADHIFPMHFWEDYSIIPRYLDEHHDDAVFPATIHLIQGEEEQYEI